MPNPNELNWRELPNYLRDVHGVVLVEGAFGIEIEMEGEGLDEKNHTDLWKKVADGSLRGESAEYVLRYPFKIEKAKDALKELNQYLNNIKLNFSYRTSVHMHVNVCDLTKNQIENLIYVSHLLEGLLVNYGGEVRKGNRFCLRSIDAEVQIDFIKEFFEKGRIPDLNKSKYSAINLSTLNRYGSLEFRMIKGTLDVEYLSNWLDVLSCIRQYALSFNNSYEIFKHIINKPIDKFLLEVFGEKLVKTLDYKEAEQDIRQYLSILIDIPHINSYKDGEK